MQSSKILPDSPGEILLPPLPLVTIAIPTFNRQDLVVKAIESCLNQTYPRIEVVVSDNASTDGTPERLAQLTDPRLRCLRQAENIGLTGNWNACLSAAKGDFFLMLSDDDWLTPSAISALMNPFLQGSGGPHYPKPEEIAFSYGYSLINETAIKKLAVSLSAPPWESSETYRIGVLRNRRISYPSATIVRTEEARQLGGYGGRSEAHIDVELLFLVSGLHSVVACIGQTVAHYMIHPANFTSSLEGDGLLASARALSALAVQLARGDGDQAIKRARNAGSWFTAGSLTWSLANLYYAGSIGIRQALGRIWRDRRLFQPWAAWPLPAKLVGKLIFCGVFGWRKISK